MNLYYVDKAELDKARITNLGAFTDCLRLNILYMVQQAGSGHLGGSLSSLDIMLPLFYGGMAPGDVFITSKGHDAPALYAILQARGIIPFETIHTLRRPGGLPGHPTVDVPGVMFNTGSLGMGISKANGLAVADRLAGRKRKIHVLVGDGELQEGQNWEALRGRNGGIVIVHVDYNEYQLTDHVSRPDEWEAPFWSADKVHNTIKGSGISFMEGDNKYHAGALSDDDYALALAEICQRLWKAGITITKTDKIPYDRPAKSHGLVKAYAGALAKVGQDGRVIVMDADLAPDCGLMDFQSKYPDRFIQCGIAEQDMVSMATGIAAGGFIPIVHSFAAFLCRRANEQIYNACCEKRHIVFVGAMAGLLPCGPGTSHESINDIEIMQTMPGIVILQPDDTSDVEMALSWAINEATGPVYISLRCWDIARMRR